MTSGNFTSVKIKSITVKPDRQRQDLDMTKVQELAESIKRNGLINPIVISPDLLLVAGERRLKACTELGWDSIPAQFTNDLSPDELHAIELEENIRRVDLSWEEECQAVLDLHELYRSLDDEHTLKDTSTKAGISQNALLRKLAVARALRSGHEMVCDAVNFSSAYNILSREAERAKANVELEMSGATAPDNISPEDVYAEPISEAEDEAAFEAEVISGPKTTTIPPVSTTSFTDWAPAYTGKKFNFLHCDFPYGIDADKFDQGAAKKFGGYSDSFETYETLLNTLEGAMENVVADSAHIIFWFSMVHYEYTIGRLRAMGWTIRPDPLVWLKSDNTGALPDPQRGPRRIYETALFGSRGDRKVVRAVSNGFAYPAEKSTRAHMSEKPQGMLTAFLRMVIDKHSHVLDPTCGTGNALRVAQELKARRVYGLEINKEFAAIAKEKTLGYIRSNSE